MELPGQQAQEGSPSGFGHSVPGPLSSSHVALLTCQGSHRLSPLRFKWGGQCQLHSEDTLQPSAAFRLAATPPYSWALVFRRQQVCPMGSHGKPLSSLSRWFLYAIHGFFSEVMFTASWDFIQTQDWTLRGVASVWVLFIYGTGILGLEQLHRGLDGRWPLLARGCLYTACIYLWEFFTGALLRRFGACPWDYSHFRYNVMGLVTLEYSPFWFLGSLLLERLVIRNILRLRLDRAPQPRGQPHARLAWKDD